MGKYNSSLTRVKPLLDQLSIRQDFPNDLVNTINSGISVLEEAKILAYGNNEKTIMPSKLLLKYLLLNNTVLNINSLGNDDGTETYRKRKLLFENNITIKNEALELLENDNTCLNKWYVFEGYTHPDIYIETNNYIIIGEAKRTEKSFTTKTKWLDYRDQLIRHIDSILDTGKHIISFLLIDELLVDTEEYKTGLKNYTNIEYFKTNLPHRNDYEIDKAVNSYIGFQTWNAFQRKYGIEYIEMI